MSAPAGRIASGYRKIHLAWILSSSLLTGFIPLDVFACPYETEDNTTGSVFAAGCLAKKEGRMLLVRQRLTGKLGIPGGYSRSAEPGRCTAYRETLEETGLELRVHELLIEHDSGFQVYHCTFPGNDPVSDPVDLPLSAMAEISEIRWLEPGSVPVRQWRFADYLPALMQLFDSLAAE
jgi:ADP-ribose pyrophosphatase YjhB (NUDIX family)